MTQADNILAYLKSGNPLTPLDALNLFGCFRLSARIYDLRGEGYDIHADTIDVGGKHVARYYLDTTPIIEGSK